MFSPPLQRLLWKDARTLVGVWGLLLVATVMMHVAMPISSWTGEQLIAEDLFAAAFVLTGCFAMTAAAMMFAGEREEGTHEWLRQLPVRPWVLIEAKIGLAVVATLLFCGAALLSASKAGEWFHIAARGSNVFHDTTWYRDSIFGLFAWGLFFSLIDRSVLRVLLCTALAEVVTVYLVWNKIADRRPEWGQPVYVGILGIVAIADGWLAWRWANGLDPGWVRRLNLDRDAPPLLSTVRTRSIERLASLGVPRIRSAGVLFWRELWGALPVTLCWGVVGVLLNSLDSALEKDLGRDERVILGYGLFFLLTPLAFGLLTAQRDQRARTASFLGDRGISPATVWWAKQMTWICAGFALIAILAPWHELKWWPQLFYPRDRTGDVAHGLSLCGSLFCCLFAAGQLCSFWFRRTVLAWALACLLMVPIVWWHWLTTIAEVPYVATTWPLAVMWLAATFAGMNFWLSGAGQRHLFQVRSGWLCAPPLLMVGTLIAARTTQVPEFDVGISRQAAEELLAPDGNEPVAAWQQLWLRAARLNEVILRGETVDDLQVKLLVDEMHVIAPRLSNRSLGGSTGVSFDKARDFLGRAGDRQRDAGQLAGALDAYLVLLEVGHAYQTHVDRPRDWLLQLQNEEAAWWRLAMWANSPDQTSELLTEAVQRLQTTAPSSNHDPTQILHRWYGALSKSLRFEGPLIEFDARSFPVRTRLIQRALQLSGEASRYDRLCRYAIATAQPDTLSAKDLLLARVHQLVQQGEVFSPIRRHPWSSSTFGWPPFDAEFESLSKFESSIKRIEVVRRAAIATLLLQHYRLRHGAFPDHISLAADDFPTAVLPAWPYWADLEFRREGFGLPLLLPDLKVLPAKQSVIWYADDAVVHPELAQTNDDSATQYLSLLNLLQFANDEPVPAEQDVSSSIANLPAESAKVSVILLPTEGKPVIWGCEAIPSPPGEVWKGL